MLCYNVYGFGVENMANNGHRGKFIERLKRILFFKRKKSPDKTRDVVKTEDSNKIYANYIKVMEAIPLVVCGAVVNRENTDAKSSKSILSTGISIISNDNKKSNKTDRELINNIDVDLLRKERDDSSNLENANEIPLKQQKFKELEKKIINLIKKDLIKVVNEMEILQSELYILSEVNGDNIMLRKCQEELDQVKNMLCKIDKLKEQYDFLKDNYDFEYLLEIDNNDLVDKIIELRDSFGNNELKILSEDYKLLDVYKYLYLKIDDLQEKTILFEEKKEEELAKLKERDIDFEELKKKVYNVDATNRNYNAFVSSQNELLQRIDSDVGRISSNEIVSYHLKGFNELFRNSFKYFGLLMISPLKGIIPSIATETLITGNLIKNLYKNLSWEEEKHIIYEAMDYSSMISNAIDDLNVTSGIVDKTLDDIVRLKMEYNDKFKKYHGDFLEYREVMQKIGDMENKIIGNKIKIEIMKKRALEQKRLNDKKMVKIKELNQEGGHN